MPRLPEKLLHSVGEVAGQLPGAVRQYLHALIAPEWYEIFQVQMEAAILWCHHFADLIAIRLLAVGRKAHHLAFIAVLCVPDEFTNHRIDAAERVRKEDTIENFNFVAFAARHHGGNEIAGTVIAEARGLLPWRAVIGAGDVGDVVLEVVLLKTKLSGVNIKGLRQKRAHVAYGFFPLAESNEIQNFGRIRKRVPNLLREIRIAVLANSHMFDIRDLRAHGIEACLNRECRKTTEMFMPVKTLLRNGEFHFAIKHDRRGGVGMKHVQAQDEH